MSEQPEWTAIDRYLAGEATPEDARAVEAWAGADARHAALLDVLRADGAPTAARWDTDAAWARLAPRLDPSAIPAPARRAEWRTGWRATAWRAAAALLLAAGAGGAWWRVAGRAGADVRELATAPGERATRTLADGSRVTLNAGSRLRWRTDYGRGARDVELEGEASFEVAHDAARPFRVHARGAVAEDLGTRFVVRAYPELARVDVAVREGRVALRADTDTTRALLGPGDVGRVEDARVRVVARGARVDRWGAWAAGALDFDGAPLRDAFPELERWYDVDLVVTDPRLAARPLVARFTRESAAEALDAIALALDARWSRRGRTVTLEPRP